MPRSIPENVINKTNKPNMFKNKTNKKNKTVNKNVNYIL